MYFQERSVVSRNPVTYPSWHSSDVEMDTLGEPGSIDTDAQARTMSPVSSQRSTFMRKDHAVGVALFLPVVILWTISGFVTQILYRDGYDKPFLVTYASTSPFSLYLIPPLIKWFQKRRSAGDVGVAVGYEPLSTSEDDGHHVEAPDDFTTLQNRTLASGEKARNVAPLSVRKTAEIAFTFCWLWFIANWAINASLNYTTVASSTIIASTSGFFTLGIGALFGVERFTIGKMMSVVSCFLGVILVSRSDSQPSVTSFVDPSLMTLESSLSSTTVQTPQPLFGDTLALISALFYAFYVVFLKVKVEVESRVHMQLFLGFVGLFDLLTCWPVGIVLHWTGIEIFEFPGSRTQWLTLIANMAILVLSDYLYVIAMLKTSPLLVTMGISLTIPFAVLGDFILNSPVPGQVLLGALLVLLSFTFIALGGSHDTEGGEIREIETSEA